MVALSGFISRLGEKGMSFYKLLKKVDKFQWTTEALKDLEALKKFLTTPPATTPSYAQSAGRRSAPVYLLHDSRGKHRVSSRAGKGRTCVPNAASSLFHQRSH
jgi:hypothetical protein